VYRKPPSTLPRFPPSSHTRESIRYLLPLKHLVQVSTNLISTANGNPMSANSTGFQDAAHVQSYVYPVVIYSSTKNGIKQY